MTVSSSTNAIVVDARPPAELRTALHALRRQFESQFLTLGALLHEVRFTQCYQAWEFATFEDFVEVELGFSARTARSFIAIHEHVIKQLEIPASEVVAVGWTKVSKLLPVLSNTNYPRWFTLARQNTVKALELQVAMALGDTAKEEKGIRNAWSVLVSPRQREVINLALEKAKRENGSENQGDALEAICADFLAGGDFPSADTAPLTLLVPNDARTTLLARLEDYQKTHDLDTLGEALIRCVAGGAS